MRRLFALSFLACSLNLSASACILGGEDGESDADDAPLPFATIALDTGEGSATPLSFTAVDSCSNNAEFGFFEASFSNADGALLLVKIKGFSTAPGSYTCTQASDNTADGVGQTYDGCMIGLTVPVPDEGPDQYAMHRVDESVRDFAYAGDCTLDISYDEPVLSGNIDCGGMVLTHYHGEPFNAPTEPPTASIASGSGFFCEL